jgi:uncharacterized protein (DUF433 family)
MVTARTFGRISIDPDVCHGKPCIAGTRIMVTTILSQLAGGYSIERILTGYPELTRDDVIAAIEYASSAIQEERVLPIAVGVSP